ncbi:unnamed protein product [Ilex paraguariensis]|uniref:Dynein light chain n=1 Tax=Ilex paraguariensis TaxID=185542 RepID=A0ABC8TW04_9AQUA
MEGAEVELERRSKFLSSLIQKKKAIEQQEQQDQLNVRVRASDMPVALQNRAFRCARDNLDSMTGKIDNKRLAVTLKKGNLLHSYKQELSHRKESRETSRRILKSSSFIQIPILLDPTSFIIRDYMTFSRQQWFTYPLLLSERSDLASTDLNINQKCKRFAIAAIFLCSSEFDSSYGPAWHCIVGTSFGSYVTHSLGGFLYFSIDKVYVLLFRTAVEPLDH